MRQSITVSVALASNKCPFETLTALLDSNPQAIQVKKIITGKQCVYNLLCHASLARYACKSYLLWKARESARVEDDNSEGFRCSSAPLTLGSWQCTLIGIKLSVFRRRSSWNSAGSLADRRRPIRTVCLKIAGFPTYIRWRLSLWKMWGKDHSRYLITAVYMSVCKSVYVCVGACVFETAQQVLEEVEMSEHHTVRKVNLLFGSMSVTSIAAFLHSSHCCFWV